MSGALRSITFRYTCPEECYSKYYSWDSDLVLRTNRKTNIIDKYLLLNGDSYILVVIYFD